jgi:hypothetical protein
MQEPRERCDSCRFFGPSELAPPDDRGTCRRRPPAVFARELPQSGHLGGPTPGAVASVGCFHTAFPLVGPDEWCGEHAHMGGAS